MAVLNTSYETNQDPSIFSSHFLNRKKGCSTAMWAEPSFVASATWLETIAAASIVSIQKTHKFCRAIPMIVRRSERMIRDVPSRAEDQKVQLEDGGVSSTSLSTRRRWKDRCDLWRCCQHSQTSPARIYKVHSWGVLGEQGKSTAQRKIIATNVPCQATTSNGV